MRLLLTAVLAVAIAAGTAWYFELWTPGDPLRFGKGQATDPPSTETLNPFVPGEHLYKPQPEAGGNDSLPRPSAKADPIVMPGCNLVVFDKLRVPSPREGVLLFVGYEIKQSNPNQPGEAHTTTILQGGKEVIVKAYRRWKENDLVKPGQMLAMVNPALALKEFEGKLAGIQIAKEEYHAATATHEEAKKQLERWEKLPGPAKAAEEGGIKKLTMQRYMYEERAKFYGMSSAKTEADKAEIVLGQHTIYSELKGTGVIKQIFKKDGEAIKGLEEFLELHNIEILRAEGTLSSAYANRLQKGMSVTVEPMTEQAPFKTLRGHTRGITAVAFSNGAKSDPMVVSASEDNTVRVWRTNEAVSSDRIWYHPKPVNALACTPAKYGQDLCLTGCQDGKIRLWDLNIPKKDQKPKWEKEVPGSSVVSAVAFSPDGKFFATGGEDNSIHIWLTETGERLYQFDAEHGVIDPHQGTITALQFTPQCRLVSASKDNTIRVWNLYVNGAKLVLPPIENRSGTVGNLGVSGNGELMLFDKGKELQLLSVAHGQPLGHLQNPTSSSFDTLALFSPDHSASLMLTAGASEGRLQLWKTPLDGVRSFEVRQWVPKERSPVTCAAFAPDAGSKKSFAVTGCKEGYVYIWDVPDQAEVESQPIRGLTLDQLPYGIQGGTQVRLSITVPNPVSDQFPRGRLKEGGTVTIVIE